MNNENGNGNGRRSRSRKYTCIWLVAAIMLLNLIAQMIVSIYGMNSIPGFETMMLALASVFPAYIAGNTCQKVMGNKNGSKKE